MDMVHSPVARLQDQICHCTLCLWRLVFFVFLRFGAIWSPI